jgi:hypothetical protein
MSANVNLVIVGIVLILLGLAIGINIGSTNTQTNKVGNVLASIAEKTGWRQISGPLFWKYVSLFLSVVCVALLVVFSRLSFPIASTRTH